MKKILTIMAVLFCLTSSSQPIDTSRCCRIDKAYQFPIYKLTDTGYFRFGAKLPATINIDQSASGDMYEIMLVDSCHRKYAYKKTDSSWVIIDTAHAAVGLTEAIGGLREEVKFWKDRYDMVMVEKQKAILLKEAYRRETDRLKEAIKDALIIIRQHKDMLQRELNVLPNKKP